MHECASFFFCAIGTMKYFTLFSRLHTFHHRHYPINQ